ncbi:MAG TPA: hypothetical protein VFO91_04865 [Anaerolineales bacterium]|nr:hypothetical protein [Anaerolineales bacterium]
MAINAADALIETLTDWRVEVVFGVPAEITTEQEFKFAQSPAKGQPRRMKIATNVLEGRIKEMI